MTVSPWLVIGLPLSYVFKRLVRSWQLFIALLLGIVLASTFFAGINVGADTAARQALDQTLSKIAVDISVDPSYYGYSPSGNTLLSSRNVSDAINAISSVQGITHVEAISSFMDFNLIVNRNFTMPVRIVGIDENSRIYDGMNDGASSTLGENETYVWSESPNVEKVRVGDILPINITATSWQGVEGNLTTLSFIVNLKVVGFVRLSEQAFSIASGDYYGYSAYDGYYPQPNLLITSWEKTFARLLDVMYDFSPKYSYPLSTSILVFFDRSNLISPWDTTGSASKLAAITTQINEKVSPFGLAARNNLADSLNNFQSASFGMRFTFIIAALPVFFVAWYMGSTVSDVSFNLRRREIGLLSTKGLSSGQIQRMFFSEALLIGLVGGLIGVVGGLLLNQVFTGFNLETLFNPQVLNPYTVGFTVAFGMVLAFLSVFFSARRASRLPTVDALREYMPTEA